MLKLSLKKKHSSSVKEKKKLTDEIKKFARGRGADVLGITLVENLSGAP